MVSADKKSRDFKYTILASLMLLKKPNLISIGLLIFFGLFVAVIEFITLICLPLGLDLYLGTGIFSNINSVKIPEFLLYILEAYNLTLLCSLIVVLSSSKLLYIFLQNRFAAFLAANLSKQVVELYLGSKRIVTRNDDSVVMARIFFGDIQVWASDFCQKIVTVFERSLFLLISLAYFVLYLPIYSIGLVGVFALISVFFVKVIQNKNENVGRELRFFSDKLMVFGEKIADGILEIKSSKSIGFFSAHYFEAYIKFAKGRAHAALLKNIPGIITTGFGQIALVLTPVLLVGLGYGKSDVTAAFIILGIILSRAVPVIGSISTDITTIFNNMPTLERLVILINQYRENQEKGLWSKDKPPVVENESNIDLLVHLKNIQASYGSDIIFKSVNLVLKSGNIYGFTGASGSGKSTLSSVIAGLTSSTDGTIRYTDQFGNEVLPEISIAPQEAILFDGSFQMNVGMGNNFDVEIASKFIKALSLEKIKNDWPLDLNSAESIRTFFSGGELQRISILRALLKPADIYIFDEPTSSLDRNRANNFFKLLRNFYKRKLIIIISHSNEDLLQCDEVVQVNNKNAYLLPR